MSTQTTATDTPRIERPPSHDLPTVDPIRIKYGVAKRALDVTGATAMLLIAFPFCLVVAALVKITSRGPVFYKTERVGLGGQPFIFVKFRSMYLDAERRLTELSAHNEKDGPIFKMKKDPRVTPIGRFMRRYSLDELPQFIHVLSGHMSLVGPRPQLPREVQQYDEGCLVRLSVKPGITCYWQVMGRSSLTFSEWMDLDRQYVEKMSFWADLSILVRTPLAVLLGRGAY